MDGRSTIGIITFETDKVAGRNLVPIPATGITAFVIVIIKLLDLYLYEWEPLPPQKLDLSQIGFLN